MVGYDMSSTSRKVEGALKGDTCYDGRHLLCYDVCGEVEMGGVLVYNSFPCARAPR